jgi:hypothetical protein
MDIAKLPLWAKDLGKRDLIELERGRMTVPAIVACLCRSERTVLDMLRGGLIPGRKVNNRWIAGETDVMRILANDQGQDRDVH